MRIDITTGFKYEYLDNLLKDNWHVECARDSQGNERVYAIKNDLTGELFE